MRMHKCVCVCVYVCVCVCVCVYVCVCVCMCMLFVARMDVHCTQPVQDYRDSWVVINLLTDENQTVDIKDTPRTSINSAA